MGEGVKKAEDGGRWRGGGMVKRGLRMGRAVGKSVTLFTF